MTEQCLICGTRGEVCRVSDMAMLRCPSCGFLWLREKMLAENYYGDLDVGATPQKIERRKRNVLDRLRKIRGILSLDDTCDIGAGDGLFLKMLQERGFRNCWGVEPSDAGVEHAHSLHLDVQKGMIEDIPSLRQQRPVQVFTLYHVLEHLDDPRAALTMLRDQLPPGGCIVIEVPNLHGFFAEKLGEEWEFYYPEHLWYFDDQTLPRFVEQCGFSIIARGRRDFDTAQKSLNELLFRLGLKKRVTQKAPSTHAPKTSSSGTRSVHPALHLGVGVLKGILARVVEMMGRTDSVWVVGQKL